MFPLTDEKQVIGRLSTAPISLNDPTGGLHVSREHARVWKSGGAAHIEDVGSRYGVLVNGRRISESTALTNDALIKLGEIELIFHGPAPSAGDLRATQFGPGVPPTLIAETETNPPASPPDKTLLVESDAKITPPPTENTIAEDDEESETRRTRLKTESRSTTVKPAAEEEDDDDELRQTRLKQNDGDDENRETQLKE